jgi:hypothetical protein
VQPKKIEPKAALPAVVHPKEIKKVPETPKPAIVEQPKPVKEAPQPKKEEKHDDDPVAFIRVEGIDEKKKEGKEPEKPGETPKK